MSEFLRRDLALQRDRIIQIGRDTYRFAQRTYAITQQTFGPLPVGPSPYLIALPQGPYSLPTPTAFPFLNDGAIRIKSVAARVAALGSLTTATFSVALTLWLSNLVASATGTKAAVFPISVLTGSPLRDTGFQYGSQPVDGTADFRGQDGLSSADGVVEPAWFITLSGDVEDTVGGSNLELEISCIWEDWQKIGAD